MSDTNTDTTDKSLEAKARRAALRVGLKACKSRWRANSIDNRGAFQVIDPMRNWVIAGEKYDMSAQEVIDYCERHWQR
jgi:hypothetical protein